MGSVDHYFCQSIAEGVTPMPPQSKSTLFLSFFTASKAPPPLIQLSCGLGKGGR